MSIHSFRASCKLWGGEEMSDPFIKMFSPHQSLSRSLIQTTQGSCWGSLEFRVQCPNHRQGAGWWFLFSSASDLWLLPRYMALTLSECSIDHGEWWNKSKPYKITHTCYQLQTSSECAVRSLVQWIGLLSLLKIAVCKYIVIDLKVFAVCRCTVAETQHSSRFCLQAALNNVAYDCICSERPGPPSAAVGISAAHVSALITSP